MVKICPNTYPDEDDQKYSQYFEKYPFPLSSFQKYAIESIVEGNHILVTAHTGSGKTLPAEFAIEHFVAQKKKVIYTSPIKALSNQKFYEFSQKFPDISFGILTGDIKTNPEADVLIMTTEILMNSLYAKNRTITSSATMFEMDFDNELACVIFDEVHYINDADRGRVWEETIMMLPSHIQMVMLSATLDSPEKFARWCETRSNDSQKIVYLTTTNERVVPLTHYSFITCTQGLFKVLKDKQLSMEVMKTTNTLHVLQDSKGRFNDNTHFKINKTLQLFKDKNHLVKRQHVLNTVSKHMVDNNMLPAICFVLSRKTLEQCAQEVTTVLLEDDSKVPYIVRNECEQIIRKLPNYQEYLLLPEYNNLVSLLEKGIGIHHAGIMPVLREMVELLFGKGYIKLLFATETFAVGINMPTKTVLFTDVNKFDGSGMRPLLSHEYTQMAGRAGRRGIDTVGHVIHLTNLFKNVDCVAFKKMMKGDPQTLVSKFKVSYNLLLNLVDIGKTDFTQYVKKSMMQTDLDNMANQCRKSIQEMLHKMFCLGDDPVGTPRDVVKQYMELKKQRLTAVNKGRKEIDKKIQAIKDEYETVEMDVGTVSELIAKEEELADVRRLLESLESTFDSNVDKLLTKLKKNKFINENGLSLTEKGKIATHIRETHCLIFADLIQSKFFSAFKAKELAGIFSCFTNVAVQDENKTMVPSSVVETVKEAVTLIQNMYQENADIDANEMIDTGIDYSMHFDLIDYVIDWCNCETDVECKQLLQRLLEEKDVFLGEFVKAILKINNIASEMEKVAELAGDMEFLSSLKQIPQLTLKYVATNQSLYI